MQYLDRKYDEMIEIHSVADAREWMSDEWEFYFLYKGILYIMQKSEDESNGSRKPWYYFAEVTGRREIDLVHDCHDMDELWNAPVFDGKSFLEIFPDLKFYF